MLQSINQAKPPPADSSWRPPPPRPTWPYYLSPEAGHLVLQLPHAVTLRNGGGEVALSHQLLVLVLQVGDPLGQLGNALRVLRLADPRHHQVLLQLALQISKSVNLISA